MKHIIKSDKFRRAWCERPGCITSLEGGIVEDMSQEELGNLFQSDCPGVWNPDKKGEMTHKEKVDYLLKYAKKEIKDWEALIKYWKVNKE